jgi:hypothetical protein
MRRYHYRGRRIRMRPIALHSALAVLLGCLCLLGPATPAPAIEVLLLWDDPERPISPPVQVSDLNANTQALIAEFEAQGFTVTLSRETQHQYNGSLPAPDDFDVVVHLNGNVDFDEFNEQMGSNGTQALAEYVQNLGGGYVCSEQNDLQITRGGSGTNFLAEITPLEKVSGLAPNDTTVNAIGVGIGHPVLEGIVSPFSYLSGTDFAIKGGLRSYGVGQPQAVALAEDIDGNPAIAIRELGAGRVVMFNHRGNFRAFNELSETLTNPTAQQLYVNAVKWADQKAPEVLSMDTGYLFNAPGPSLTWEVEFTEAVSNVDLDDFELLVDQSAALTTGNLSFETVSSKHYRVTVDGLTGVGFITLRIAGDTDIVDVSHSANPFAPTDAATNEISVDALKPVVVSVATNPAVIAAGQSGAIVLAFDEPMATGVLPTVNLQTASSNTIGTLAGAWSGGGEVYTAPLERALTPADAGPALVEVSGAQDFAGNVMEPSSAFAVQLISDGMTATLNKRGPVLVEVGAKYTFSVTVEGAVGEPLYQWFKEDGAKADLPVGPSAPEFVIASLTYGDAGTYYCQVIDSFNFVTVNSPGVTLNVVESVPVAGAAGLAALAAALGALGFRARARRRE